MGAITMAPRTFPSVVKVCKGTDLTQNEALRPRAMSRANRIKEGWRPRDGSAPEPGTQPRRRPVHPGREPQPHSATAKTRSPLTGPKPACGLPLHGSSARDSHGWVTHAQSRVDPGHLSGPAQGDHPLVHHGRAQRAFPETDQVWP